MCRFSSGWDVGYLSISSFINRLSHYQTLRVSQHLDIDTPRWKEARGCDHTSSTVADAALVSKKRDMTERERRLLHALVDPDCAEAGLPHRTRPSASSSPPPAWLLNHAHFQSWYHRGSRHAKHKLLWLNGPVGGVQSHLLSAIQSHIAQHWAPATDSSAIVAVTARERRSILDSVLWRGISDDGCGHDEAGGSGVEGPASAAAAAKEGSAYETLDFAQATSPSSVPPAGALRSILSQLYAHDPRLRNLVLKKAATPLHGAAVFETTTPFARQNSAQKSYSGPPNPHHSERNSQRHQHNLQISVRGEQETTPASATHRKNTRAAPESVGSGPSEGNRQQSWSDSLDSESDLLDGAQARDSQRNLRGAEAGHARGEAWAGVTTGTQLPGALEDVDVVSLFLEDYLCLDPARDRKRKRNDSPPGSRQPSQADSRGHLANIVEIPGLRRVFVLVDATAGITSKEYKRGLLWCLSQLAQRSDFSICVATATPDPELEDMARTLSRSTTLSVLPVMMTASNAEEIHSYVESHLNPDIEERQAIATKMLERSGGMLLWAEMVCVIVNEASEEGVSGEVVLSMLDDISPRGYGRLDDLYAWKLGRITAGSAEQMHARLVFEWVMLAPEALRLNELLVALRMTLLTRKTARKGTPWWDTGVGVQGALDVEPPMSLQDLRNGAGDEAGFGIAMDSPTLFWRWVQKVSHGLVKLASEPDGSGISNEPLGLQHVRPVDESVLHFFLRGKGFQSLLAPPEEPGEKLPSTERFIDTSYYTLLHACLRYLNMVELDSLGREKAGNPMPGGELPPEETSKLRKHAEAQRKLIMSSYPFLRYAVDNLVFHLLCPRQFRYFLPQRELLHLLSANRCRIWRRWTQLLGFNITDAEPQAILAKAGQGPAKRLLDPVYGAKYRLERVLRRVWKTATEPQRAVGKPPGQRSVTPRKALVRSRSDVSESSMVFTLVGGDDPLKSQWLVPATPRSRLRSNSSPATPRSPGAQISPSPVALAGIREMA